MNLCCLRGRAPHDLRWAPEYLRGGPSLDLERDGPLDTGLPAAAAGPDVVVELVLVLRQGVDGLEGGLNGAGGGGRRGELVADTGLQAPDVLWTHVENISCLKIRESGSVGGPKGPTDSGIYVYLKVKYTYVYSLIITNKY